MTHSRTGRSFAGFYTVYLVISSTILTISSSLDILNPSQSMRDGETLVSADGSFELGFFSPQGSRSRYLGLWYKKSRPVLWVANRETPLSDNFGVLKITGRGILILLNSTNNTIWSSSISNESTSAADRHNPVAELLESGNLVVREGGDDNNPEANFLWQSFDHPTDTMLPGMRLGFNFVTQLNWSLSSWKSAEDPAQGYFSFLIDLHGYPQLLLKKGNTTSFRAGSWDGIKFTVTPIPKPTSKHKFVLNKNEVYFELGMEAASALSMFTLSPLGQMQTSAWNDRENDWVTIYFGQFDQCENYAFCGPNTRCEINRSPICNCIDGFMPKSPADWNSSAWSGGCIRRTPLNCSDKDGFRKYPGNKLPDTSSSWFDKSIGLEECKGLCLKNCSCSAYATLDIRGGGSGCLIWLGELIDIRRSTGDGQVLYVRMAASELAERKNFSRKKKAGKIATVVILSGVGMVLVILGIIFCKRKRNLRKNDKFDDVWKEEMELPLFDLSTIAHATNNFSSSNKLGEGGFGLVYKGILTEGQDIAVKRLSQSSNQGLSEFKNEVILIAKLQHRNLVKLLGCCIHEDEKILIYEYMPNRSLDSFIYDQTRKNLLDWRKRINVIFGVARGLLYLHQDSRLRVIHRDIKASNILLDKELDPKISDFGLARMFRGDQTDDNNTNRVVGTYGYMSPEYASNGHFSVKSDVFSFGVLVLEIVSGRKNRTFCHLDRNLNLLGYAWILWMKGSARELIDECLIDSCNLSETLRCIHVALLCVQQRPEDRPNMSTVVLILGSENPLPQPRQPGFFMGKNPYEQGISSDKHEACSANTISLTSFEAR